MDRTDQEKRLIFTSDVLDAASRARKYRAPWLLRWAARPSEDGGDALRAQLERAAALVPEAQRARVLGPLRLPAKSNDQARCTVGNLLLAKTLDDLGWEVDFEPAIEGGTPDLRIAKGGETYVIEIRRVDRLPSGICDESVTRILDALDGVQSETMISIRSASVPGSASLKPFVAYLRKLLSSSPPRGEHVFHDGNVLIVFHTLDRFPEPMPVVFGWQGRVCHGSNHEAIRGHLDAKIKAYKVPLIVALDFYEPYDAFEHTIDVLIGQPVTRIRVPTTPDAEPMPPELARDDDGLVLGRGASGERARSRLQAVLPFYLSSADDGSFALCARLLANPAAPVVTTFDSFAPIPRFVCVEESNEHRTMRYLDERGDPAGGDVKWRHVP